MADNIPSIIKEAYHTGQLLQVADFEREQDFHIQYRNFQTRQLLSAGVISGLLASGSDTAITVTSGAAINKKGEYILLTADKSHTVTETDGDYQLIIKQQWAAVSDEPNQLKSDPELNLVTAGTTIGEDVLLANVTIKNKLVSKLEAVISAVKILPSRIPEQSIQNLDASIITKGVFNTNLIPDLQDLNGKIAITQLPEIQELNGKIATTQLPNIQELNGKLNADQIPDLQNLPGQLTRQQLPSDMDVSKEYITFFVTQAVVSAGSEIQLSWSANEVDSLSLSYFSETGINILSTNNNDIQLIQSNYPSTPLKTTTFTLTAQIKDTIVAQKQLTITVVTLLGMAELQFQNKKTASQCVLQLKKQFSSATAKESAIVLAKVGYTFEDTGRAVKNDYNITDAAEFGKTMAAAFPA